MSKKKFTTKMSNTTEPAAPASVWGYRGCPGKGGKTLNSTIFNKANAKESE